jgi:prolyl-tRNA editing enzyme YbaK/EbsC (Cys-tRNA(Pro) deacylase)
MRLRVQDILDEKNIPYRIIELKQRAITVNEVIESSVGDINPDEICKTILVKQKKQFYALFLRGANKIDFKKLKSVIGKASIVSREDVIEITGVKPGAVCPLLLDVPLIVDVRVLELEKLNFGSGNHLFGVEISSSDLNLVVDFRMADIARKMQ